jgi:hypothetical protein
LGPEAIQTFQICRANAHLRGALVTPELKALRIEKEKIASKITRLYHRLNVECWGKLIEPAVVPDQGMLLYLFS